MRNLKLVLAGLILSGAAFAADDPVSWKHNAEIRTRLQNDYNTNAKDAKATQPGQDTSYWEQRNRLGLLVNKGEQVTGYVNVVHSATWGRDLAAATIGTESGDTPSTLGRNNPDNNIFVAESWLAWRPNDMMTWKVGRGGFQMADGSVVGKNDYEQVPTVFEGVMSTFDLGFMNLGLIGVKGADWGAAGTYSELAYDQEANFYGLTFDLKNLPDFLRTAHLHVISEHTDVANPTTGAGKSALRWGVNLGGDYMGFDYNIDYASVDGKKRHTSTDTAKDMKLISNMLDVKVGFSLPEFWKFRIGAVYHQDSGDKDGCRDWAASNCDGEDNTYDGFFYDRNMNLSGIGKIGWGNSTYTNVNLAVEPMENTKVGFTYWMFSRTSEKDFAYSNGGVSWLGAGSTKALDSTGHVTNLGNQRMDLSNEWDFRVTHQYTPNFLLEGRYSQFNPGTYFMAGTTSVDVTRSEMNQFFLSAKLKL